MIGCGGNTLRNIDMAYQPLSTFDFSKLFVPVGDVAAIAEQNKKSLVSKGKEFVRTYPQRTSEHFASLSPITPEGKFDVNKAANLVGGFVGGGMKNVGNTVVKGVKEYLYHATPEANLSSITAKGLVPRGNNVINHVESNRKIDSLFLSKGEKDLKWWSDALKSKNKTPSELRVDSSKLSDKVYRDELGTKNDVKYKNTIPPEAIELKGEDGVWRPLVPAKPLFTKAVAEAAPVFQGFKDYTTRVLESIKGKSIMSPATISSEINRIAGSVGMKKAEADLYHSALFDATTNGKVDVQKFADSVHDRLLPLKRSKIQSRYEGINLPAEEKGITENYKEIIYESPIKTSAGNVHFSGFSDNYFAHVRRQDISAAQTPKDYRVGVKGTTRRIIEVQSDLMQKGGLDNEVDKLMDIDKIKIIKGNEDLARRYDIYKEQAHNRPTLSEYTGRKSMPYTRAGQQKAIEKREEFYNKMVENYKRSPEFAKLNEGLSTLRPYEQTWFQPVIRSEIKQAAIDGKTKLQFPTGETAMKIEGLVENNQRWFEGDYNQLSSRADDTLLKSDIKTGAPVNDGNQNWIITDVLGDGKFKAVQKSYYDDYARTQAANRLSVKEGRASNSFTAAQIDKEVEAGARASAESFDISGKVDTTHGVYMRYEEIGKWLKNRFGAQEITDPQGVKWYEVPVDKSAAKQPIIMHGNVNTKTLVGGTIVTGALAANEADKKLSTSVYNKPDSMFVKTATLDRQDFITRLVKNAENTVASSTGQDLYKVVGVTKDLGKYQVNPTSLKDWSRAWLGRVYTAAEFLADPKAQEKFMSEFLNMVDKYRLSADEAAVTWHNGWGKLGTNLVDKEKIFRDYLRNAMTVPENVRYLEKFNKP